MDFTLKTNLPTFVEKSECNGMLTFFPKDIMQRSFRRQICFGTDNCCSSVSRFHFKNVATFKPKILRANCFRSILNFPLEPPPGVTGIELELSSVKWLISNRFVDMSGALFRNWFSSSKHVGSGRRYVYCLPEDNILGITLPGFVFSRWVWSNFGFNKNSNHNIVSLDKGILLITNKSSIFIYFC